MYQTMLQHSLCHKKAGDKGAQVWYNCEWYSIITVKQVGKFTTVNALQPRRITVKLEK